MRSLAWKTTACARGSTRPKRGWKRIARRRPVTTELVWGEGSDSVALFKNLPFDQGARPHRCASRAGSGASPTPGMARSPGLSSSAAPGSPGPTRKRSSISKQPSRLPEMHEAFSISMDLVGPTILTCGTVEQQTRYLRLLRRADEMWCQLFSEPGAGSDLAGVSTRAERDGESWVLNGQKVWTSGAQYADFGYVLARSDPDCTAARRADRIPHPDGCDRSRCATASPDERRLVVQRGLLGRCARPGPSTDRGCRRRVGGSPSPRSGSSGWRRAWRRPAT